MATFTYPHSFGSPCEIEPKVHTAEFGDGYSQRVGAGINAVSESWELTFNAQTGTERAAILAFLRARAGVEAFDWTSPTGVAGKWICPKFGVTPQTAAATTVTATFKQVFDL